MLVQQAVTSQSWIPLLPSSSLEKIKTRETQHFNMSHLWNYGHQSWKYSDACHWPPTEEFLCFLIISHSSIKKTPVCPRVQASMLSFFSHVFSDVSSDVNYVMRMVEISLNVISYRNCRKEVSNKFHSYTITGFRYWIHFKTQTFVKMFQVLRTSRWLGYVKMYSVG